MKIPTVAGRRKFQLWKDRKSNIFAMKKSGKIKLRKCPGFDLFNIISFGYFALFKEAIYPDFI